MNTSTAIAMVMAAALTSTVLHGQTSGNRTSGTAFVVSDDGLLLTAFHVIDGASLIMVKCPGVDPRPAFVEAKAPTVDLAVLRVKWLPPLKDHLSLATGAPAAIGDRVFTIGYPSPNVLGVEPKYTEGTISSTVGPRGDASFYQVSVPVQPGNSGGALLDESGRVLGIIVSSAAPAAFLKDTGTLPQNVNWAVKAVYATPLLPSQQAANNAPKRLNAKDRSAFITHATAASCLVVADQPKGPPQKVVGGVVGGVAGGVAGGVDAPPPPPPPPPPPTVPMRVGGAIHAPRRITNVNPIYPAIAQNARVQGVVIIEATIGTTGEVKDARVLRSIPLLDQAALDAVKQWRYEPTLLNGTAVPIIMTVTVNFALTEDPAKEEQACLAGEIVRCGRVAAMSRMGYGGMPKDPAKAATLYQRACDGGIGSSCQALARMYESGEGVTQDAAAAAKFDQRGCDAGSVISCIGIARATYAGRGVTRSVAQGTAMYDRAAETGRRACAARDFNNCEALAFLGLVLQSGQEAPQNVPRAIELYRTACENGAAVGCAFLGAAYTKGNGVTKDLAQAATLYERACPPRPPAPILDDRDRATMSVAGRVQACGTLGEFYEHGTGVPQSNSQAILFYQRACDAQQIRGVDLPKLQNRCEDALRLQGRP